MSKQKKKEKSEESKKTKSKVSKTKIKPEGLGTDLPVPAKEAAAAKPKKAAPRKKVPAPTSDDIALRAYFIAERRQQLGLPGDETGDWVEAERQLRAEAAKTA